MCVNAQPPFKKIHGTEWHDKSKMNGDFEYSEELCLSDEEENALDSAPAYSEFASNKPDENEWQSQK
jgi:hypothetical protein